MRKKVYILCLILLSFTSFPAQSLQGNYKLSYPLFIPEYSDFSISLITSNIYPEADKLNFYILPGKGSALQWIELRKPDSVITLLFEKNNFPEFSSVVYRAEIDLRALSLESGLFFQLLSGFTAGEEGNSVINFIVEFAKDDSVLGRLKPHNNSSQTEDNLLTVNLKLYSPLKTAGNAARFDADSKFQIEFNYPIENNLLTEFWFKTEAKEFTFLKILNKMTGQREFELSINHFGLLQLSTVQNDLIVRNPSFISENCWYHISVFFSYKEHYLSVYSNGNLVGRTRLTFQSDAENLAFLFGQNSGKKYFYIDQLRIFDYGAQIEKSFYNRKFISVSTDSSALLKQLSFDDPAELIFESTQGILNNASGIQLIKSDAPLTARAPELNVRLGSSFNELIWSGGDFKRASEYLLERSTDNSDYKIIYSVKADTANQREYSYPDSRDLQADVIYYRVRQINSDGSVVYSSQVKIGQGSAEQFVLEQNYPNPFNPKTSIKVELLEDTELSVIVYNLEGKVVEKIQDGFLPRGVYRFEFDATELPSGIYLYKVSTPLSSQTKKMILTK